MLCRILFRWRRDPSAARSRFEWVIMVDWLFVELPTIHLLFAAGGNVFQTGM
jgi:hypothetical protein